MLNRDFAKKGIFNKIRSFRTYFDDNSSEFHEKSYEIMILRQG